MSCPTFTLHRQSTVRFERACPKQPPIGTISSLVPLGTNSWLLRSSEAPPLKRPPSKESKHVVLQIWKFGIPTVETEAAQRSNAEAVGCRAGHVGRGLFPNSLCVPDGLRTCPTTLQSFTLNACETPGTPETPETPRLPGLLRLPRLPRHPRLPRLLGLPRRMARM